MKNNYIVTAIIVLVVGAAAFYGGMQYQKSQRATLGQFDTRVQGGQNARFGAGPAGSGMVVGDVTSKDDTSITVKSQDGSSKIVILSASTTINKQATGTKDDLKSGEKVAVFGKTNADGSVTAQSIQLNPQTRTFRGTGVLPTP